MAGKDADSSGELAEASRLAKRQRNRQTEVRARRRGHPLEVAWGVVAEVAIAKQGGNTPHLEPLSRESGAGS